MMKLLIVVSIRFVNSHVHLQPSDCLENHYAINANKTIKVIIAIGIIDVTNIIIITIKKYRTNPIEVY